MKRFTHGVDGVQWYCEQRGTGPHLVLVPSGEGDCASFAKTADALADGFTVLTFDTPGFSRSSRPADPADISLYALGGQIARLVQSLGISEASFYGCSSGGVAVLDLVAGHPGIVRNAVVHEAAIIDLTDAAGPSPLSKMLAMDDAGIVAFCENYFENVFNEDPAAWRALGTDYHERLRRNYVTWVREYVAKTDPERRFDPATLTSRPVAWTVGGLSRTERTIGNIRLACRAGIDMRLLPCVHFPQVSIPERLAAHIRAASVPHL